MILENSKTVIFTCYVFIFLLISLIAYDNRCFLKRCGLSFGSVLFRWSSALRPSVQGIYRWISMLCLLSSSLYWLLHRPGQNFWHANLLIFLLLISIYTKIDTIFTEGGIVLKMKQIKWNQVQSWALEKDRKCLSLFFGGNSPSRNVRISIPDGYREDVQRLMLRILPERQVKSFENKRELQKNRSS